MKFDIQQLNDKYSHPYYAFVDVEVTTSSAKKGDVLSLGCIIAEGDNFKKVDSFLGYARPRTYDHWNSYAENIHKITRERSKTFPDARQTSIEFLKFLAPFKNADNSPIPFVFHGTHKFDLKMVQMMFAQNSLTNSIDKVFSPDLTISTCSMFEFFTQLFGVSTIDKKLSTMAKTFNIPLDHHEVMSDTNACYASYRFMRKAFGI